MTRFEDVKLYVENRRQRPEVAARTRMGDVMVHVSSRLRFERRESYLDMSVSGYHKVWDASTVTL
jgi:hypothetical protein